MSTSSLTRRARGLLVLVTLALLATVLGPAFPVEADANATHQGRCSSASTTERSPGAVAAGALRGGRQSQDLTQP